MSFQHSIWKSLYISFKTNVFFKHNIGTDICKFSSLLVYVYIVCKCHIQTFSNCFTPLGSLSIMWSKGWNISAWADNSSYNCENFRLRWRHDDIIVILKFDQKLLKTALWSFNIHFPNQSLKTVRHKCCFGIQIQGQPGLTLTNDMMPFEISEIS